MDGSLQQIPIISSKFQEAGPEGKFWPLHSWYRSNAALWGPLVTSTAELFLSTLHQRKEENLLQLACNGGRSISSQNMYANAGISELSPPAATMTAMTRNEREREGGRKKDREGLHQSMQIHYFFVPLSSTRTTLPPWTKERVSKSKHVPLTHPAPRSSVWSLTMPILISNLRHRDPSWMRMNRKQNNTWFLKKLRNDMKGCFLKQSILRTKKKKKKTFKKYFASYIYQDLSSK